ncbi:MFS transporter [Streptomyces parvulus]|uniref:MFS transporter n=1 Tax=Streptomyces parvulus TaxID=146923 RepID=UPI003800374D
MTTERIISKRIRSLRLIPKAGVERKIASSTFISSIGFGMYISGSAVYFVNQVGLAAGEVGVGMSIAGLAWLPLSIPIGTLADRWGARQTAILFGVGQTALLISTVYVHSFAQFLGVIVALGIFEQGGMVVRGAIFAEVIPEGRRVKLSAYTRSLFNLGFTIGALLSGIALSLDTRSAYLTLMLGNAVSATVVTVVYATLPYAKRRRAQRRDVYRQSRFRDYPYVAASVVCGILEICDTILTVGIPLWVVSSAGLPNGLAAWAIALNTVLVVLLQVRFSKGLETPSDTVGVLRRACLALVAACTLMSTTGWLGAFASIIVLVAAVVLLTAGELWNSAATWSLRYGLAPEGAQGQYGGAFELGSGIPHLVAGPLVVTMLIADLGATGWALVALVFLILYLFVRPAISWAVRTRQTMT